MLNFDSSFTMLWHVDTTILKIILDHDSFVRKVYRILYI